MHATTVLAFSRADAATVFAAFSFANLVFSPVSGPLASRFGRRRVLIFGVAIRDANPGGPGGPPGPLGLAIA